MAYLFLAGFLIAIAKFWLSRWKNQEVAEKVLEAIRDGVSAAEQAIMVPARQALIDAEQKKNATLKLNRGNEEIQEDRGMLTGSFKRVDKETLSRANDYAYDYAIKHSDKEVKRAILKMSKRQFVDMASVVPYRN